MVSNRLHSPSIQVRDQEKWAIKTEAFPALINQETFEKVQEMRRLEENSRPRPNVLQGRDSSYYAKENLRKPLSNDFTIVMVCPRQLVLRSAFGTIRRLYELAGYQLETRWSTASRNTLKTREQMEYI